LQQQQKSKQAAPGGEDSLRRDAISSPDPIAVQELFKSHDYEAEWEYLVIEDPDEAAIKIANDVKTEILPELRMRFGIADFTVTFVEDLGSGCLGKYIDGTYTQPVMVLDFAAIKAICEVDDVDIEVGIETTITHELAHAIHELLGLTARSEIQAEEFAREWWKNRRFAKWTHRKPTVFRS